MILFIQVFTRLNKLGLSLSHYRTLKIIHDLGSDHDAAVHAWKSRLEGRHTNSCLQEELESLQVPVGSSSSSDSSDTESNTSKKSKIFY